MKSPLSSLSYHRLLGSSRRNWRPETILNMDDNNIVVVPAVGRRRHRRRVINYAGEFRERVSRWKQKIRRRKIALFYFRGEKIDKNASTSCAGKKNPKSGMIVVLIIILL